MSKSKVIYIYATLENRTYVEEIATKHNIKISDVANKIIEGYRTGKKVSFTTNVPEFVKKAEAWKKKHVT
jgi:hypothetical protein